MMRNRKGWLRIIEIALAATLVFSFMLFINTFETSSQASRPVTDKYLLEQLGEDALRSYDLADANSDDVSDLRFEVLGRDWDDVGEHLNMTLGSSVAYSLYFQTPAQVSFATGQTIRPLKRDVATVYYIISGGEGKYCAGANACALKLDLWYIK